MEDILGILLLFAIVYLGVACYLLYRSKSKSYREFLTNMLVAGKVRQLAVKEKVDLIKESAFFDEYCKKSGIDGLLKVDNQIEKQLADKLNKKDKK